MAYSPEQIKRLEDIKAQNRANLEAHIKIANEVDLFAIMTRDGYALVPSGLNQHMSVNNLKDRKRTGNLFISKNPGSGFGNWVYVPEYEAALNPIAYAMREYSMSFPEAVRYLDPSTPELITIKNYSDKPRPVAVAPVKREPPPAIEREKVIIEFTQPMTPDHERLGRAYCTKRGISDETIEFALKHKVIGFGVSNFDSCISQNRAGVRFLGYDAEGNIRSAETRHFTERRSALAEKHCDRSYCPILPGNPKIIHITEGGFDGLGLRDMCIRHMVDIPTIIIAGGTGRTFVENEVIKPILLAAEKIIIWAENERSDNPDPDHQVKKQAETDKKHALQREDMINAGITAEIVIKKPRGNFKDLAEKNLYEKNAGVKIQAMRENDNNTLTMKMSDAIQDNFKTGNEMGLVMS